MRVRISEKKFVGPSVRLSDRPSVELEFSGKSLTKDKQVHGTLPLGDQFTDGYVNRLPERSCCLNTFNFRLVKRQKPWYKNN